VILPPELLTISELGPSKKALEYSMEQRLCGIFIIVKVRVCPTVCATELDNFKVGTT